ncbi:AraC family ligand binding domain-containing protein [Enterococcus malodoratus]|uniref:AraC family ligand binding domain-containing protein n=1 Tax=Enterococcus malodoratus TaxID=71451 RepID=UPI0039B04936
MKHSTEFFQIYFWYSGQYFLRIADDSFLLRKGDILLLNSEEEEIFNTVLFAYKEFTDRSPYIERLLNTLFPT